MFSASSLHRFSISSLYLANSGIPLFSQSIFYQTILLIPIIAIEAYVYKKLLKTSVIRAILASCSTNAVSTFFGGFLVLLFGVFVSQTLFRSTVPVQPGAFPFLPIEIIVTLIPMFAFSVLLESFVGIFAFRAFEKTKVRRSILIANTFTYLMLEILAVTQLVKGYIEGRG